MPPKKMNNTLTKTQSFLNFVNLAGQELKHDDISLHQLKVFFYVAYMDEMGRTVDGKAIAEALGLSTSGVSRTVATLGEHGRGNKKGLRLLETEVDPEDRRKKYVHLSRRGKAALDKLAEI